MHQSISIHTAINQSSISIKLYAPYGVLHTSNMLEHYMICSFPCDIITYIIKFSSFFSLSQISMKFVSGHEIRIIIITTGPIIEFDCSRYRCFFLLIRNIRKIVRAI